MKDTTVIGVAFRSRGDTIAAGCGAGVALFDTASLRPLGAERLTIKDGDVTSVAFAPGAGPSPPGTSTGSAAAAAAG